MSTNWRSAVFVLAITTGILAGCGQQNAGQAGVAGAGSDAAAGEAAYQSLVTQIYGTPSQRAAVGERAWLTAESAIATCAHDAGVTYSVPPYVSGEEDRGIAPGDVLAFAPLRTDFGIGARIQRLAAAGEPVNRGLAAVSTAEAKAEYRNVLQDCQAQAATGDALAAPPGQQQLDDLFVATLRSIQAQVLPNLPATYAACMKQAGIDATDLSQTYVKVAQGYPGVNYEEPSNVTKLPTWADAVAFEKKAAAADAACRSSAVDTALAAAPQALARFTSVNQAALDAHAKAWEDSASQLEAARAKVQAT